MQIGGYSKGALLLIKVGRPYISLLRSWQITPLILLTHIFRFEIRENNALVNSNLDIFWLKNSELCPI
jgi:hypothetical protein